ncbi:hypothetical protein TSUD_100430 [Trifolium subterraneum]|uniref:DUF2921 domain-containing protein n=1 Tax=Trifolium subterraneum TaxID=3900 RepID=A0A2Z6PCR8_TRISU|nr:hypothetical protein TSUD_100430 [Trifolium subterraneum]
MIMNSLLPILFFLFTFFSFNPSFSLASKPSYKDHCASIIPETTPTTKLKSNSFPLSDKNTGDYIGGDSIINVDVSWNKFSLYFPPRNTYATSHPNIFKIEGTISFRSTIIDSYKNRHRRQRGYLTFKLDGFWSKSSGNVCMVGKSKGVSKKGDSLNLDVVFKLNNVFNSSNVTSLISGSLESLSSEKGDEKNHYFEPISLMMFPKANYNYSLDSKEVENEFSFDNDGDEEGLSLNFDSMSFCSYPLSSAIERLQLEYTDECNSSKNCTIISGNSSDQLASQISLKAIGCSFHDKKHRIRVLVEFSNSVYYYWNRHNQSFNTKSMLIGEGWWDEKKNMLCLVLCHFTGTSTITSASLDETHVGDCSIRLRLRFPSIWSIENTSSVVGQIWTNKSASDQNYFKMIAFRNDYENFGVGGQDLKYEYSQLEKVKQSCSTQKVVENKGKSYPDAYSYSYDMRFDMSVRESKKKVAWGSSSPIFVDDQYLSTSGFYSRSEFDAGMLNNNDGLFNISYKISLNVISSPPFERNSLFNMSYYSVKISAEGVYDSRDGTLCMVGCRDLVSNNEMATTTTTKHSLDCEILMKFQFPSLDTKGKSFIKGSIESTRQKSDPLYFKQLEVSAVAYYIQEARRNVWRMDIEVIMALVPESEGEVEATKL